LDLYDRCAASDQKPIFFEAAKRRADKETGALERFMLYAVCKLLFCFPRQARFLGFINLVNCNYGDALPPFFKGWSLDECALLGAKFLHTAFEVFKQKELTSHRQIAWHRGLGKL
jgi:hypothetical protein